MDFQLKQAQLETEQRRSEREHEMNVLRLTLGHRHVSTGPIHYAPMTIGAKITQGCQPIQCISHLFPRTLVWTIFLFQTQMAQHLQPCNTVLYSCF